MREGVHKIKYDVEGNKTVMDLYYETGCVFRETYIDGKLISIECPKEKNKERNKGLYMGKQNSFTQ